VPRDHPELDKARALGLPVVRRADALGELVAGGTEGGGLVAIAGTHGKTTTTVMATEALTAAGRNPTGLAGGRVAAWGGNARLGGDQLYVVEADEYDKAFLSLRPTIAVVNNVEADHLECYGSMAALEDAFVEFASRAQRVIVGADDTGADRVASKLRVPVWRVGQGATADVRIRAVRLEPGGSRATLALPDGRTVELELAVPGLHNVRNALAAAACALGLGMPLPEVAARLSTSPQVPGRMELLVESPCVVLRDYSHTPDALERALATLRPLTRGRLVVVFGCGGDRDKGKRPLMGRIAAEGADVAVVTSDNPRTEDPATIIDEIEQGMGDVPHLRIVDRLEAIHTVLRQARAGDTIVLAGKGHETYQVLGTEKVPFDVREIVRKAVKGEA
jgi:UDP-N-acetylmuramyl-tripeptide synthetase